MTGKSKPGSSRPRLNRFEAGSELGPVDDLNEREARINFSSAIEKELAQESSQFADLCQFFEEKGIDVPREVVEQLTSVAALAIPERINVMKKLNQSLMECLHDVDPGTGIRQ
jgi:hypothetical protein